MVVVSVWPPTVTSKVAVSGEHSSVRGDAFGDATDTVTFNVDPNGGIGILPLNTPRCAVNTPQC